MKEGGVGQLTSFHYDAALKNRKYIFRADLQAEHLIIQLARHCDILYAILSFLL